jgi:hypothetical protein
MRDITKHPLYDPNMRLLEDLITQAVAEELVAPYKEHFSRSSIRGRALRRDDPYLAKRLNLVLDAVEQGENLLKVMREERKQEEKEFNSLAFSTWDDIQIWIEGNDVGHDPQGPDTLMHDIAYRFLVMKEPITYGEFTYVDRFLDHPAWRELYKIASRRT